MFFILYCLFLHFSQIFFQLTSRKAFMLREKTKALCKNQGILGVQNVYIKTVDI